jgi:ankyrin repeat protein
MDLNDCCCNGNLPEIRRLLRIGLDVNNKDCYGWTPLHRASYCGHISVVKELINCGADIHAKKSDGRTALHLSSSNGHIEIVIELLKHYISISNTLYIKTNYKNTPLHLVSYGGYLGLTRLFVDLAITNQCDSIFTEQNVYGDTPLHMASKNNHLGVVRILIDHSDLSLKNNWGYTALDLADNNDLKEFISNYEPLPFIKEPDRMIVS